MSIFIKVNYQAEEVNAGYWAVFMQMVLPREMTRVYLLAFILGSGCLYTGSHDAVSLGGLEEPRLIALFLLVAFAIPTVLCLLLTMFLKARVMKSYDNRPNFHFPIIYIISENGLAINFASGQGTLDWHNLIFCLETPDAFCLAAGPQDVFVLPKRCFADEEELESARKLIRTKVRSFNSLGQSKPIKFEKKAVQLVSIDGEPIENLVEGQGASSPQSGAEGPATLSPLDKLSEPVVPLSSGLAVEILYQEGEVAACEKIYFFRKRLPLLTTLYIIFTIWMVVILSALGIAWGIGDSVPAVLQEYSFAFMAILPIFAFHALYVYLLVTGKARIAEEQKQPVTFQLTEEGCGVRAGERYAVLAWWHFEEAWETADTFMLLFGRKGRAMYVIPKRAFPDRSGPAYVESLLKRKLKRYNKID